MTFGWPVVSADEMRRLEAGCVDDGISTDRLMDNAGLAIAQAVTARYPIRRTPIVVLVGPGNNGGDGLVAAGHLASWGAAVHAIGCSPRILEARLPSAIEAGVRFSRFETDAGLASTLAAALVKGCLVIDALLGTGTARPVSGSLAIALTALSGRPDLTIVAIDLPSGMNADTGQCDPHTPQATLTLTLGAVKQGHLCFPGAGRCGELVLVPIGIPAARLEAVNVRTLDAGAVASMLPARRPDAHKGSRGRLLVIAGSRQYPGAAGLVCRAAHRAGAGLVTLACPPPVQPFVAPQSPETTYALLIGEKHLAVPDIRDLKSLADRVSALAIGPGLGTAEATRRAVHLLAGTAIPAVWDADALNALADTDLKPGPSAVITPHPGEAARLLAMETHEVNQDRFSAARRLAAERQCTVVLKGPQSIVADHDGRAVVWPTPVPALATGGSGDVLTGVIGALLAQGCEPFAAAAAGVYLHARAGQRAAETHGDTGVVASDLPPALGVIRQELQLDLPPAGL